MPKITNPLDTEVVLHYAGVPYRIPAKGSITVDSPEIAAKLAGDLVQPTGVVPPDRKGK